MLTQNAQRNTGLILDLKFFIILPMNIVFVILIALAYFATLWQQLAWNAASNIVSPMQALCNSIFSSADQAVELSIGLIGIMTFFLGLMKIAEASGLLRTLAKLLHPVMTRLFPDVPSSHPAQGAIIMNISANLLGLGNAATPFGIKAMQSLDSLNPHKGTATNAMVLFLAMNTASITLIPTKVIALRSAAGSHYPANIISTTLFASICATCIAIMASKTLQSFFITKQYAVSSNPLEKIASGFIEASENTIEKSENKDEHKNAIEQETQEDFIFKPYPKIVSYAAMLGFLALVPIMLVHGNTLSPWIMPSFTLFVLVLGLIKKIRVYEVFTEGAKEGFWVSVRIIPYLVSMLVAMSMLKSSHVLELITSTIAHFTAPFGLPAEALPVALMRPLSGTGAMGVMTSVINDPSIGPDSYLGYLVSTLMGSTDTTFYIIALYFGAIQIKHIRHTVPAALLADLAGIIASVFIVNHFYG